MLKIISDKINYIIEEKMKITDCIQELTRLLSLDGNLNVELVTINKDNLYVKVT